MIYTRKFHGLFFLLLIIISFNKTYSQDNVSTQAPDSAKINMRGTGKIYGFIVDKDTRNALEGVTVTLKDIKDSASTTGAITDANGRFNIETSFGTYKMSIDYIGYRSVLYNKIILSEKIPELILDTIKLSSGTTTTEEINVTDEKSMIQFTPGKKVINVGKNDLYNSGSAIDVLKDIPSVTVDIDNNVSLRGSSEVKILIDGRPSGLNTSSRSSILEQIPANTIESIELVTNPDAKYDAEGTSGVINIILKKNNDFGVNGTATLGTGTDDKYTGGLSLNAKNSNLNIFGSYNYRLFNSPVSGFLTRINFVDNTIFSQSSNALNRLINHSVKGGIDYYPDAKSTIGFSINYSDKNRKRGDSQITTETDAANNITYNALNQSEDNDLGYNLDADLNYVKKFKTPKQQLNLDIGYSRFKEDNTQISNIYDRINPVANIPIRNDLGKSINNDLEISLDYSQPFKNKSMLDAGCKATIRNTDNTSTYRNFDYTTNTLVEDIASSNSFNYKDFINAIYSMYSGSIKDFSYSLGLRGEQTNSTGDLVSTNTQFTRNYFNIFPSISLQQKLGLGKEMQFIYSRRIKRPDTEDLNPFIERSDPLNLRQGNPYLNPMFIDSYELSFINYIDQTVLTPSIYYRQTHDEITRFRTLLDSNVTLTSFTNNSSSKTYGAELIFNTKLFNALNLNGNINYYRTDADASFIQAGLVNSAYSWSGRLLAGMNVSTLFNVQLSYNYNGRRVTSQTITEPVQTVDIALKKELLIFNNSASISFKISDLFDKQKNVSNLNEITYTENLTRRRNIRTAFLTFTYNFGKQDKKSEKKKSIDNPSDDSGF